jgi:hypothetical protein
MNTRAFVNVAKDAGFLTCSYSGRGMFGKKCVGIILSDAGDPYGIGYDIGNRLTSAAYRTLGKDAGAFVRKLSNLNVRGDSLGMGAVVYFPEIMWED